MIAVSIIITAIYLILIISFIIGFDKILTTKNTDTVPKTTFSVIIPFRNEAENLPELLQSISQLNYPKELYEIIFVDDESDDGSIDQIMRFLTHVRDDIKIIPNIRKTNSPKKDAITTAITQAKYDWIVTTDADCILPKQWLHSINAYILQQQPELIAMPVIYKNPANFIERFQLLDILSLQGATVGGFGIKQPFLSNGANLAYKKSLFYALDGFEGNTHIAGGDDVFLLEKAVKNNIAGVHYLKSKSVIVTTKPQPDFKSLLAQRIRWTSKTGAYQNHFGKLTGIIVLLMNALLICLAITTITGISSYKILVSVMLSKFISDLILINKSAHFFECKAILKMYLFGFFIYPFFSTYVAVLSVFTGYKWKSRTYSVNRNL